MEDLLVAQNLKILAAESAKRLRRLVDCGEELSFELGNDGAVTNYEPQTARFVRDHADAMRAIDAYRTSRAAIEKSGFAAAYLEAMGVPVPGEAERRSDLAVLVFLCRLWDGSTEFVFDDDRLAETVRELHESAAPPSGRAEVIAPILGLQLPVSRIALGDINLVRADLVEIPAEARQAQGSGSADWEPAYIAAAQIDLNEVREDSADGVDPIAERFHRLITTLRIFKPGGVGLGPHAWVRAGGADRWRRIATGTARPRPGVYRIADEELSNLVDLARAIDARPDRLDAMRRSLARFEVGVERHAILDSLNDHLIALRFMLEGTGLAGSGIATRVAALCADAPGRQAVREAIERAITLERQMWSGEARSTDYAPARVAGEIEDLTRIILRRVIRGEVGIDLRAAADQLLLGENDRASAAWGLIDPRGIGADREIVVDAIAADANDETEPDNDPDPGSELDHPDEDRDDDEGDSEVETIELEALSAADVFEAFEAETSEVEVVRGSTEPVILSWFDEIEAEVNGSTLEWPARSEVPTFITPPAKVEKRPAETAPHRAVRRSGQAARRVQFLFPEPGETRWSVGELAYQRKQRSRRRAS